MSHGGTRNWAGLPALPRYRMLRDISKNYLPQIYYALKAEPLASITCHFDPKTQHWKTEDNNHPLMPSLILYARRGKRGQARIIFEKEILYAPCIHSLLHWDKGMSKNNSTLVPFSYVYTKKLEH